jgi:glycyl-tRNA synthetase (class II)
MKTAKQAIIEEHKRRVEEALEDAEAAHFAYETWMIQWRVRRAEEAAGQAKRGAYSGGSPCA